MINRYDVLNACICVVGLLCMCIARCKGDSFVVFDVGFAGFVVFAAFAVFLPETEIETKTEIELQIERFLKRNEVKLSAVKFGAFAVFAVFAVFVVFADFARTNPQRTLCHKTPFAGKIV